MTTEDAFKRTTESWVTSLNDAVKRKNWAFAAHCLDMIKTLDTSECLIRCVIGDDATK